MIFDRGFMTLEDLLFFGAASGGKTVEDTATGNPLTFTTDIAKPLKSLLIPFTPVQSGTGDPSPENVRPIAGITGLNLWHGGKNLLDPAMLEQGGIDTNGTNTSVRFRIRTGYIPVKENTVYAISAGTGHKLFMHFYDANKGSIGTNVSSKSTSPPGACYVRGIIGYTDDSEIVPAELTDGQIEVLENSSATATAYEPYKPITDTDIVFPSPVYGGILDVVSGVLTVEWAFADMGDLEWVVSDDRFSTSALLSTARIKDKWDVSNPMAYCSIYKYGNIAKNNGVDKAIGFIGGMLYARDTDYETAQAFTEAVNGVLVVYELATPQEITLTPAQITALVGNNTIWSDTNGSNTAVYLKKA